MEIEPFDLLKNIKPLEIYQRICYYHNEANDILTIINDNKKQARERLLLLYNTIKKENKEYSKVKYDDVKLSNNLYSQYCSNIMECCAKCINANSNETLNSNVCEIIDNITYGFYDLFSMDDNFVFNVNNIEKYLYKKCVIELNNYNIYIGDINLKLTDGVDNRIESISVLMFDKYIQLNIDTIKKIKIVDNDLISTWTIAK